MALIYPRGVLYPPTGGDVRLSCDVRLSAGEQERAVLWMRRNADSIQWWLLSTPELRRCRFHRYLHKTGRLGEGE